MGLHLRRPIYTALTEFAAETDALLAGRRRAVDPANKKKEDRSIPYFYFAWNSLGVLADVLPVEHARFTLEPSASGYRGDEIQTLAPLRQESKKLSTQYT